MAIFEEDDPFEDTETRLPVNAEERRKLIFEEDDPFEDTETATQEPLTQGASIFEEDDPFEDTETHVMALAIL